MNPRKIIPVVILIIVLAGLVYYFAFYRSGRSEAVMATSGHVEVTEVDLSFRLPGHVTRLLAEEGDQVKKGRLLAELQQEVLKARYDQAEAVVREIESQSASLKLTTQIKEEVLGADVEKAKAGKAAAEARYQSLKTGSRWQEIREAEAALDRAKTEMENRERDFERMKKLYQAKIISASQYDDTRTATEAVQAAYKQVLERYRLVKAGPRVEAVQEGKANLTGSDAVLNAAEAARREVEKLKLDQKALEAKVDQARAQLATAKADLTDSRLYAPFDGFITVKAVEEQEFVQAGTPVLTLARLDRVWVKTFVPETQLGRVRLGQEAMVESDSYPGKTYQGQVTFISPEAEFTPKNVQTKEERVKLVYRIKVTLDNPKQELKPGMPVDVVLR
ncbi:MAG: efflux RND transporter periplasmic adaptor subunit [Pseudomonadota bacterium]